jgi:hypothetical protein
MVNVKSNRGVVFLSLQDLFNSTFYSLKEGSTLGIPENIKVDSSKELLVQQHFTAAAPLSGHFKGINHFSIT